jgi:acyl-coenzyme A synthetase/AMP-(fatty) acid ligase
MTLGTCSNAARVLIDVPAATHPERVALVTSSVSLTYANLSALSNRIGHGLVRLGCAPGHRVLLAMADSLELVATLLAVVKIGALAVPVPPGRSVDDYGFYLEDTDALLAIADADSIGAVSSAASRSNVIVLAAEGWDASLGMQGWWGPVDSTSSELPAHLVSPDDPALVLYTSGSTGQPKAAIHSHRGVTAATRNVGQDAFGIRGTDRVLSTARLFFSFGLGFGMTMPLACGASIMLNPTKDLRELAQLIADRRPTILCGVPSLLEVLFRASATWLTLDLSSLRFIVSAGEPLSATVYDGYRDRFGVEVLDGIGSTEMLTHFITNRPGRSRRDSCGTPVSGCEVSLVDDDGVPVPDGEIGNLRVSGETAFIGYWNRPDATAGVWDGCTVATGDRLFRDTTGFYHYCGRNDDMLKISGLWVSPAQIESVLCRYPGVERCIVTTRGDREGRRRLVAYVNAAPGVSLRPSELSRHVADRLPEHMIPAAFVRLDALPLTPNGKVQRSALPEPVWATSSA